jgi:hypothetical protein
MIRANCSGLQGVLPPLQPSDAVPSANATLPAPAAIAIGVGSTTSGVGNGTPSPTGLLHQEVLPRRQRHVRQLRELPRVRTEVARPRRRRVLDAQIGQRRRRITPVEQLHVIVRVRRTRVPPTPIHLTDHHRRRRTGVGEREPTRAQRREDAERKHQAQEKCRSTTGYTRHAHQDPSRSSPRTPHPRGAHRSSQAVRPGRPDSMRATLRERPPSGSTDARAPVAGVAQCPWNGRPAADWNASPSAS